MIHGMALCPGVGGLELGIDLALGPAYRTVCYVEREAFVAGVLAARMQDGDLAEAPIWDDVRSFDGRPWRDRVDLISAGFPCQPFSQAGKRESTGDPRYLWDDIARVIGEVEPVVVCLENVPGLLTTQYVPGDESTRGEVFGQVLADLAALGYVGAWRRMRAADVGARHRRDRVFIVAVAADAIDWLRDQCGRGGGARRQAASGPRTDGARGLMADADRERREQGDRPGDRSRGRALVDAGSPDAADPNGLGREGRTNDAPRSGQGRGARRELADADGSRWQGPERAQSSGRGPGSAGRGGALADAPGPTPATGVPMAPGGCSAHDEGRGARARRAGVSGSEGRSSQPGRRHLADADSRRREGLGLAQLPGLEGARGDLTHRRGHGGQWGPDGPWSIWQTEPDVGRVVDGLAAGVDLARASRRSRLRATGNGCVPQQAAVAIMSLLEVLT